MDVSPERLRRFFTRAGKHYQIVKSIRDNCIFARQNLTRDPPFSRLDLVSCRNVLIYLEPSLQKRVIPVFHYALKPSGYLLLGASETIGGLSELLTTVDKKRKIYAKNVPVSRLGLELLQQEGSGRGQPLGVELHAPDRARPGSASTPGRAERAAGVSDAQKEADRLVMDRYAPPGVLVNAELSIVQFRGHTGPFLEPAPARRASTILKMARRGLALELRAAIHKARRTDATVRVDGIQLGEGGPLPAVPARVVSLEVVPLQARVEPAPGSPDERWFLVLFQEHGLAPVDARPRTGRRARAIPDARVAKLERELAATREYLQVTLEEQEATNEELQSTNEELLSSNEELQSINEELETAKEEQEATNEELTMLNQELKSRNGELNRITNDLGNLLGSVDIPIVMLGNDLDHPPLHPAGGARAPPHPPATSAAPSATSTRGSRRPIRRAAPPPRSPLRADLERLISEVIDTASIRERDVRDREGRWYSMRIRPYRTHDNQIDGAVIVLVDIDRIRRGHQGEGVPIATADRGAGRGRAMATYPKRSSYGIFVRFRRSTPGAAARGRPPRGRARHRRAAPRQPLPRSGRHLRGQGARGTIVELAPRGGRASRGGAGAGRAPRAPAPVVASRPQAPAPEPRALEETSEALAEPRAPEEAPRSPGSPAEPSAPAGQDRVSAR